jgi:hypothetical protein
MNRGFKVRTLAMLTSDNLDKLGAEYGFKK